MKKIIVMGVALPCVTAGQDLGRLPPTDYIMGGNITKTATGYNLQMSITKTADKMTAVSYSGTCTFAELDNLSGIRRASLDLLEKMGVTPTEGAKTELAGAASQQAVNGRTALAQGIVSQKSGTMVESLTYYYQAAAFDPTLLEAAGRTSVMTASITSGNIGAECSGQGARKSRVKFYAIQEWQQAIFRGCRTGQRQWQGHRRANHQPGRGMALFLEGTDLLIDVDSIIPIASMVAIQPSSVIISSNAGIVIAITSCNGYFLLVSFPGSGITGKYAIIGFITASSMTPFPENLLCCFSYIIFARVLGCARPGRFFTFFSSALKGVADGRLNRSRCGGYSCRALLWN
jgi:hypothetical protein